MSQGKPSQQRCGRTLEEDVRDARICISDPFIGRCLCLCTLYAVDEGSCEEVEERRFDQQVWLS